MSFFRFLIYFIILTCSFILQSTFFEYIQLVNIKPNIMLIIIVSIAYIRGEKEGAAVGFAGGLMQDCFFATYVGSNVFLYTLIGFLCGVLCRGFYKENFLIAIGAVAASSLVYGFLYYVINILLRGYTDLPYFARTIIIPEVVYNALLSLIVYNLFFWFNEWLEDRERYRRKVF